MATSNLGSNIGDAFLNAYLSSKKLKQDQEQFDAQMEEKQRYNSIMDRYYQGMLGAKEDKSPYDTFAGGYWDKSGEKPQWVSNETQQPKPSLLGTGLIGGRSGLKYGYMEGDKEVITKFDEFSERSGGGSKMPDISSESGDIAEGIQSMDNAGVDEISKQKAREKATNSTTKAMMKYGIPENSGIISDLWNIDDATLKEYGYESLDKMDAKDKRQFLKNRYQLLKPNYDLSPTQDYLIKQYIEVKTR